MWAAAVVLAEPFPGEEPWNVCAGPTGTIALPLPDVVVHDPGEVYTDGMGEFTALMNTPPQQRDDREMDRAIAYSGAPVLACVVLGSSGGSWAGVGEVGDYFQVTRDHLDIQGVEIVDGMEEMYGRPVHIVTYLDT